MKSQSHEAAEQARKYANSISQGVPSETLAEIIEFSKDARRRDWFAIYDFVPFWYERFDREGLTEKLKTIAEAWVENEQNITRAATQVKRHYKVASKDLILAFGVYKFKKYMKEHWELVPHPARCSSTDRGQTMVCIALEDLGPDNGFPFALQRGQDICIDGNAPLFLPPTGGGMAVLIWIDL